MPDTNTAALAHTRASPLNQAFPFGTDVDTGERVELSLGHFLTSYWCVGEIGIGKSNHVLAPIYQALRAPLPAVIFDGAGTLATNVFHAVACIAARRMAYADRFPEFRDQAARFVLRHPLLVFGGAERHLSIDLLRRQVLPDGRRETLEQVATRTYQVFNRLFADDADKRVRFRRVAMSVITILAAAGRPIREYKDLLFGREGFLPFCLTEAERIGLLPGEDAFHRDQVQIFLALQRLAKPTYRQETESTDNALNYFHVSPGADYVNDQTLDLPRLLGSGGKLLISHVLADLTLATVLFRAYDSIVRTWVRAREPIRLPTPHGLQVIDEPFWIDSGVVNDWAIQRNKRWSVLLLHQREGQLETVSPGLSDLMYSFAKLRGQFRPEGRDALKAATDLAYRLRRFRPDGLLIPYETSSSGKTTGLAESLGRSWSETRSRAETFASSASSSETTGDSYGFDERGEFDPATPDEPRGLSRGEQRGRSSGAGVTTGSSESVTHGTAHMQGKQEQATRSNQASETWSKLLHFTPVSEQALVAAQEILRTPEHVLFLSYGGKSRRILLDRQREYPGELFGIPVSEHARAFQQDVAEASRRDRPRFDAGGSAAPAVVSAGPKASASSGATMVEAARPTPEASPAATGAAPPLAPSPVPSAPHERPFLVEGADGKRRALGPRDQAILEAAADWHFVALDSLRLDPTRFGGYSGLVDRVQALYKAGLLERLQPPAPRGTGSLPNYYLLARRGAQALAALTTRDEQALFRVVENVARTRGAVERLELGQLHHQLGIANLLALASAGVASLPGGAIVFSRFDKEVAIDTPTAPVDQHLTSALRSRLYLADGQDRMSLRPDALIVVRSEARGEVQLQPYLLEVETGRKETSFEELAHAATLRAYAARAAKAVPRFLEGHGFNAVRPFRLLYVAATPSLEERLATGVRRAVDALRPRDRDLVLLTSLDLAHPPVLPTTRAERAEALRAKSDRFFSVVWRTADREERIGLSL